MYHEFYGLTERPFDLTPNTRYLYLTPMHREALAAVQYGITSRRGIIVVTGEAGTGKTTIVRAALRALRGENVRQTYLNNPALTRDEFLQFLGKAYRLGPDAAESKTDLLSKLTAALARNHAQGQITAMVVDEAQSLPHELLEEIRLLANIETSTAKLLQVVLVGQPELADRLNDPSLRQLKQRVAIRATLKPLDLRATAALIAGRIRVAGGNPPEIFTPAAVELVYRYSGGVARTINVICDNALLSGFAADQKPVGPALVEEVCKDFDLTPREARAKAAGRSGAAEPPRATLATRGAATPGAAATAAEPAPLRPAASNGATVAEPPDDGKSRDMFTTFRHRRWFPFGKRS
ncbi:MAG: AAA family ATPase [Vicinamibacterales bacterium]